MKNWRDYEVAERWGGWAIQTKAYPHWIWYNFGSNKKAAEDYLHAKMLED